MGGGNGQINNFGKLQNATPNQNPPQPPATTPQPIRAPATKPSAGRPPHCRGSVGSESAEGATKPCDGRQEDCRGSVGSESAEGATKPCAGRPLDCRARGGDVVLWTPADATPAIRAKKEPGPSVGWIRANTWRRPTLTGPIVPLPLALRRFTSGFGMGPGGSTSLWSPEGNVGVGWRVPCNSKTGSLGA